MMQLPLFHPPPSQPPLPPPPPRKSTFRWELLGALVGMVVALWLIRGAEPALSWLEFLDRIGVQDQPRFTRLATLGLVLIGVALMVRWTRK